MSEELATSLMGLLINSHPYLVLIGLIIGYLRILMKPLSLVIHVLVAKTETKKDDIFLEKFKASKCYSVLAFLLDLIASVKLKR